MPLRLFAIRDFEPLAEPSWIRPLVNLLARRYEHPAGSFFRILGSLNRDPMRWLDIGAGRNWLISVFNEKSDGDIAIGVDLIKPSLLNNPKRFAVANAYRLPFKDSTFHLVTSYWVVEHISDPDAFVSEIHRVLVPEGHLLLRTTNPLSPITQISRIIPNSLKKSLLMKFLPDTHVFHEVYDRMNHPKSLRNLPTKHGFKLVTLEFHEPLMLLNPLTAIMSILYWQVTRLLPFIRTEIVALYQKIT